MEDSVHWGLGESAHCCIREMVQVEQKQHRDELQFQFTEGSHRSHSESGKKIARSISPALDNLTI